jgi:hypothetical protein
MHLFEKKINNSKKRKKSENEKNVNVFFLSQLIAKSIDFVETLKTEVSENIF